MHVRICAALALLLTSSAVAFAAPRQPMPVQPGGLFQGTPEEQAACSPDATRFCSDAFPDTFRVLACLQRNRGRLRKACLQVLEAHGQ